MDHPSGSYTSPISFARPSNVPRKRPLHYAKLNVLDEMFLRASSYQCRVVTAILTIRETDISFIELDTRIFLIFLFLRYARKLPFVTLCSGRCRVALKITTRMPNKCIP